MDAFTVFLRSWLSRLESRLDQLDDRVLADRQKALSLRLKFLFMDQRPAKDMAIESLYVGDL
jgi:hypothetical protein